MGTYRVPRLKINLAQNSSQFTRVRILHKNALCIIEEDGAYVKKHNNTCASLGFFSFLEQKGTKRCKVVKTIKIMLDY